MGNARDYHGALVAFEGPSDVLSTQLRLLPTSPQIQILPPIENYLKPVDEDEPFDAKLFIRRVHDALTARDQDALSFLKDSTTRQKRLVFTNGGTASAYAACIEAIADHETNGDLVMARQTFEELMKNGLAGLEKDFVDVHNSASMQASQFIEEDPTVRAMRAADALDRLTANLQPSTDLELSSRRRPRSMSLPMYSFDDRFGDAAPFYVFGTQSGVAVMDSDDETYSTPKQSSTPVIEVPDHYERQRRANYATSRRSFAYPPSSPSCVGETYGPPTPHANLVVDMFSPRSEYSFNFHPSEPVIFGRASVVQVRPSGRRRSLKRTRSLDRMVPYSTQYRDTILRMQTRSTSGDHGYATDRRRHSCMDSTSQKAEPHSPKRTSFGEPTRTLYVRTEQPIIALSPAPIKPRRKAPVYVDRGTDAAEDNAPGLEFQPAMPFTEDLVISFKDGRPDGLLEFIVHSFRAGMYPLKSPSAASETSGLDDEVSVPMTPSFGTSESTVDAEPPVQVHLVSPKVGETDDYDPFAYESTGPKSVEAIQIPPMMAAPGPPTPARTPPPESASWFATEDKFHDCNVADCKTAVAMQNDLRHVLNLYFPSSDKGYHQFHFSLLPEMGGMWKPIFSEQGTSENSARRIDQILAVGAEKGVQRAYVSGIAAELEQLGTKPGEISRSGRLDFRYLMANAMQTFTAQPLAYQTRDNPFTSPYLLATLIIPHLETFFVTNPDVRFLLLDYPPDHLPTILALQKLVGVELMKVAQVVDSTAKEPLPFTHIRGPSLSRTASEENTSAKFKTPSATPPHNRSQESVAISKANFLLTSTATEAEIIKFVTTIRSLLAEVSSFYNMTEDQTKSSRSRRIPTPIAGTFSAFPRASMVPQSPPLSPSPLYSASPISSRSLAPRPSSPASSVQTPPSLSDTVKTIRSGRSRRERRPETVPAIYIADEDDGDGSELDVEERRLMPMFDEPPRPRKGNSHKALKFLGLA